MALFCGSTAWAAVDGPRVLSKSETLLDRDTGDVYLVLTPKVPARVLVTGPGRLQAEARVNLPLGNTLPENALQPIMLEVLADGRTLARLKLQPSPGAAGWKGSATLRPSSMIGFYLDVDPGAHTCEFRVDGAAVRGVALRVLPVEKAAKPLASNAPVIAAAPPAAAPAATVAPSPTGTPQQQARSIDEMGGGAVVLAPLATSSARPGDPLDLGRVSGIGAGAQWLPANSTTIAPYLSYRYWLGRPGGVLARASFGMHSGRTIVSASPGGQPGSGTAVADGQGYDGDVLVGGFWNAHREPSSTLFLQLGVGPSFHKEIRQGGSTGLRTLLGLGMEITPPSIPSIGFTLEGGFRVTSYKSDRLGTAVEPTVGATFHYYLNRPR